jgi:hypothetical protein
MTNPAFREAAERITVSVYEYVAGETIREGDVETVLTALSASTGLAAMAERAAAFDALERMLATLAHGQHFGASLTIAFVEDARSVQPVRILHGHNCIGSGPTLAAALAAAGRGT